MDYSTDRFSLFSEIIWRTSCGGRHVILFPLSLASSKEVKELLHPVGKEKHLKETYELSCGIGIYLAVSGGYKDEIYRKRSRR